jgi:hypothetical protein
VEVEMRLRTYAAERATRFEKYAEKWDRLAAEREAAAAKERRDRFTVVGQ